MEQKYWLAENGTVRCLDDRCPQECDTGCPIYLQTMALSFFQSGHFAQAASYLGKAVEIEPTFAEAWNNLAACCGQMNMHQKAYDCYRKSYELLKKPKPLFGMAVAAKNLGQYDAAMRYVEMYENQYGSDEQIAAVKADTAQRRENENKAEFIRKSRSGKYEIWKKSGFYMFCTSDEKNPQVIMTNDNRAVKTQIRRMADAILDDLDVYGPQSRDPQSVAGWQADLIEQYLRMEGNEFAEVVKKECLDGPDWTESIDRQDAWTLFFKNTLTDRTGMVLWIDRCTHMQLNAILHVCRALKSIRIALSAARIMEDFDEDQNEKLAILIKWIADNSDYSDLYVVKILRNFKLVYGIHLEENGDLFGTIIDYDEDQFFVGKKVSVETLIGRNYYLYEDGRIAGEQPKHYEPGDIRLSIWSDDNDNDEEEEESGSDGLDAYLPEKCWVRRISALEDGQESYYLIAVTVDENNMITEIHCIHEVVAQQCVGGMFFLMPGFSEGASVSEYEEMDTYPARVFDELGYLISGRALRPDFSIIGKPVPQWMKDHGEEYSFALQSGYRAAYTHIGIDSDDEEITDLDYSSYQSSSSSYGDMFSRPQMISDRKDEAVDMILYIIDHYTEKEWDTVSGQ